MWDEITHPFLNINGLAKDQYFNLTFYNVVAGDTGVVALTTYGVISAGVVGVVVALSFQ